ncbi:AMP-binding protein [Propionivibrio soli]|uniref:AMP-binding protein n=1 Tax=Propionivibrio soli TaxID=2976531 RepID=UPI0021E7F804
MERIWLQSYQPGVPAEVDVREYESLGHLFESSVARFRDRVAYICMGARITYGELDKLSRYFAGYLQNELKLPKGSRIAIMMPNVLQYPICMFGALRAGYIVVNCNPMYMPRELEHQLSDSGAETIVILENFAHTLAEVITSTPVRNVVIARLGDMLGIVKGPAVNFVVKYIKRLVRPWAIPNAVDFNLALARGGRVGFKPLPVFSDDLAFLQYTGGTTGVSKGAMLSHRNILANVAQAHAWVKSVVLEDGEFVVTALPLYHIFAMTANCFMFIKVGGTNLLITNPRDIPGFVSELSRYRFTIITGVNTLFNGLLNNERFARLDFSHMKVSLGGGTAVQRSVAERWKKVTGKPLVEAYGLTETSPAATINPIDIPEHNGSIGLPIPSTEVAIRDDNGVDVPLGERGELCVRGPQVMKGYYNQSEETANVFMPDGFLRTGDIVVMDERGYLRIVDRKKDMIIVSGFNVYPTEIEDVLMMHPAVLEAAAIGVPDDKTGEAVKAFVVRKEGSVEAAELIAHCRKLLTRYKVPSRIEFRDTLPKTNLGKVLRRALREEQSAQGKAG